MKGVFVILSLVACASALSTVDTEWEEFKTKFNKQYSPEEDARRHQIFKDNKILVEEHNKKYDEGKVTFTMGLNKFADLLVEETFYLRGFKQQDEDFKAEGITYFEPPKGVQLLDTVDWRDKGYVTSVKDQGECGSSWAFSTVGAMEGQHADYAGVLTSLSPQNLLDCDSGGCNYPKNMRDAFMSIHNQGGIYTEESYPYKAADGICSYKDGFPCASCNGYVAVPNNEDDLLTAVAIVGPIAAAIDSNHTSFQLYTSGVYYESACDSDTRDHAILIVGYGTENLEDYWLVKNSWGVSWGESGYIKMARNRDNNCGIASEPSYPAIPQFIK